MILTNHHGHSYFSDGHGTPEQFVERALEAGLTAYGFSDHAPIPLDDFGSMDMEDLPGYDAEVKRLREVYADRIQLHKSLEVDYIPDVISVNSPHILDAKLDYTVGAVHFIGYIAGRPWSFQQPEPTFQRGINELFGGNARQMVERYFELIREMVTTHPPDVVAHLDRVKKRNLDHWDEHADWHVAEVEKTLDVIAEAGIIMEVNTRGLYKQEKEETYPSRWIVRKAHERGIPLQVNSDVHELPFVTGGFDFAYSALREIGVKSVRVFLEGEFKEVEV